MRRALSDPLRTLRATTVVSERWAASLDGCIKQRVGRQFSSKKGDGQENRRLGAFFFRFLNQPIKKARGVCPEMCPNGVP